MRKIREVMRLRFDLGMGACQIAWSCGISIPTVHEYLNRAGAADLRWPLPEDLGDDGLGKLLFPGRVRKGEPDRPLPDFADVRRQLAQKGVTLLLVWQEYKRKNPNGYGRSVGPRPPWYVRITKGGWAMPLCMFLCGLASLLIVSEIYESCMFKCVQWLTMRGHA